MGVCKSLKTMGWLNAARLSENTAIWYLLIVSVVTVDAAPVLAAGSKSLSTFVSDKERVLSWRWQWLETGMVGILDTRQNWVWLQWCYCTNPLPSWGSVRGAVLAAVLNLAVSHGMVEHQACHIAASRTRSVKERATCWPRRGDLFWAALESDPRPLLSMYSLPFGCTLCKALLWSPKSSSLGLNTTRTTTILKLLSLGRVPGLDCTEVRVEIVSSLNHS